MTTTERLTRRRALGLVAAAAGLPLALRATRATAEVVTWRGRALGAPATLILHHPDRPAAERLVAACVAELERLEAILSLYRPDSALSALNRAGALAAPPPELVAILADCRRFHAATDGAFDPTVQPLWRLYAEHFQSGGAPAGPDPAAIAGARARIGFAAVVAKPDRIVLPRPGMALTLNGVAQGWITDRIVERLRAGGVTSSLVDMGEIRALGDDGGAAWRVGVADSDAILALADRAVATSSPAGFRFDPAGRFGHILDPRSGAATAAAGAVTVTAPDAATADALSTALVLLLPAPEARAVLARFPEADATRLS
ncbi:FAD:protein FMN transferase [Amaricoccus sp.]|uniref:FAD:protein FMN transferase n=1 Tax=Amaricoccus sp. TaxID=1872485 RepID=UPI001B4B512F|nr:FAD:protein FMN transferase [Amaricoccus sp.]MBP7002063.1 FAD:protein FMN transferase [Amaricoccus sp.]